MFKNTPFNMVMQSFNTGYWELHPDIEKWSDKFYENLGYTETTSEATLDFFLTTLIHPKDIDLFRDNFISYRIHAVNFHQHIKIKDYEGKYRLFRCATNDELPTGITPEYPIIFFFEVVLPPEKAMQEDVFYYNETAQMTATGSWYVDFEKKQSYWDFETRRILEYPDEYTPSLKDSVSYYPEESKSKAATLFFDCAMEGTPFNTEIKMLTANGRVFWVRAIGKPVYSAKQNIIGIRGIFQDIDEAKRKKIKLQRSNDIIASQNSRLFNFAHIVSHNLRSHTSNLSLLVQLIEGIEDPIEKSSLIGEVKTISESLNTTIEHLNEIAMIHTNRQEQKKPVRFDDTMALVCNGIRQMIDTSHTEIHSNFDTLAMIEYIPAYLESILLNLITNAIKYKHPDRNPVVHVKTYVKDDVAYLQLSDNGIGIDLERFGDKIFGMYKTFHYHKDAVGIGLYLTKNQIEAMEGKITIESKVNVGTTFTIRF